MSTQQNAAHTAVALIAAAGSADQEGIESLLAGLANDQGEADGELICQLIYALAYMGAQLATASTGGDTKRTKALLGKILLNSAGRQL